jgi:hypothetical protein
MKASDPEAAIEEFLGVPAFEPEKGDWGFKGLKQAIKLEFKLGQYDKVCWSCHKLGSWWTNSARLSNTIPNYSPMSRAQLHEIIRRNPLITYLIT